MTKAWSWPGIQLHRAVQIGSGPGRGGAGLGVARPAGRCYSGATGASHHHALHTHSTPFLTKACPFRPLSIQASESPAWKKVLSLIKQRGICTFLKKVYTRTILLQTGITEHNTLLYFRCGDDIRHDNPRRREQPPHEALEHSVHYHRPHRSRKDLKRSQKPLHSSARLLTH